MSSRIRTTGNDDFTSTTTISINIIIIITTTTTTTTTTNVTASYYVPSATTVVITMTTIDCLHHSYGLWCDDCGCLSLNLLHITSSISIHGWTCSINAMTKNIWTDRDMLLLLLLLLLMMMMTGLMLLR